MHNNCPTFPCPKCDKLLSMAHVLKKHLLTYRPEKLWMDECPMCHKTLQARGDLPKHLRTKMHEADNIPKVGSNKWNELIFYD